jgi:PAS domain S-box-containing protein
MIDPMTIADQNQYLWQIVTDATPTVEAQTLSPVPFADLASLSAAPHLRAFLLDANPNCDISDCLQTVREHLSGDLLFVRTDINISQALRDEYNLCLVFPAAMPLQWIAPVMQDALGHRPPPTVEHFITQITHYASNSLNHDDTIDRALVLLRDLVPYTAANITVFEEGYPTIKYHHGYPEASRLLLDQTRIPRTAPNFQKMMATKQPLLIPDVTQDDHWQYWHPHDWIRSWLGVPIKKHNAVIGIINFDSDTANRFQPYHRDLILKVVDHIALLVETHQLYDTLNEYTVLLSVMNRQTALLFTPLSSHDSLDEMCRHIAETVVSSFGQTDCGVMLVNSEGTTLNRYARAGEYHVRAAGDIPLEGKGLVTTAAKHCEPVYAPDVSQHPNYAPNEPRTRSELVLPLVVNNTLLGVLDLQSNQFNAFSLRDQDSLWAFAQYAALALQNLLAVNAQRDLAREMEIYVAERTRDLEISQRRVEAIINHAHDAILLLSADGKISQGNAAFGRIMGLGELDYYEVDLREIIESGVDAFDEALQTALTTQRSQTFAAQFRTQLTDPTHIQVEITLAPVSVLSHEDQTFVCTIRDVTHYLEVEQSLRRTLDRERELSHMKSDFIQTIHHQFNTPLSVIMSSVGILQMSVDNLVEPNSQARLTKHFDKINQEVRHLAEMLEETKIAGDTQRFSPNILDIVQEVERGIQTVREGLHVSQEIQLQVRGKAPSVVVDPIYTRNAIFHLLSNAVKFSPRDSTIEVHLNLEDEAQVTLDVVDYGIGIPENELKSLFMPFFKGQGAATSRGVGLGLTIIKQAADLHSGAVTVASTPGQRTQFTLTLPRKPQP